MGTGYTIGGDTWQLLGWDKYAGQTFRCQEDVTLYYLKLYLKTPDPRWTVRAYIFYASISHEPMGSILAIATFQAKDFPPGVSQAWVTRPLSTPVKALAAEYFAIVVDGSKPFDDIDNWIYDAGDAAYPYGHRIQSNNKGVDWSQHITDDHLFYIWGTPPAPPPPPPPPDDKWAPIGLEQETVAGGFNITFTTDAPCHLHLFWTDKPPWVHREGTSRRGLKVSWDSYWCFVVWHLIEQTEPGDTLIHSFSWLGWEVCQTKYFRFHGTIGGSTVVCDSPIFHKHYSYVPPVPSVKEDNWTVSCSPSRRVYNVDGYAGSFEASSSYTLTKIRLSLMKEGTPSPYTLELRDTLPGGCPGPNILAQKTLAMDDLPNLPICGPKDFELDEIAISAGTIYSILLNPHAAALPDVVSWIHGPLDMGGTGSWTRNVGVGCSFLPENFCFQVFGY